jgi:hypothetical protein
MTPVPMAARPAPTRASAPKPLQRELRESVESNSTFAQIGEHVCRSASTAFTSSSMSCGVSSASAMKQARPSWHYKITLLERELQNPGG